MIEEAKAGMEIFSTIGTVAKTLIGVAGAIFYLPSTISGLIVGFIHTIVPWDPKIDSTVALVVAVICFGFWFTKWDKVRKALSDALGLIPFGAVPLIGPIVGGILKLLVWYTHYILFGGIWGVTRSGWIAAAIMLVITLAVNSMSTLKKIQEIIGNIFNKGASLASDGGNVIKKGIKLIPTVNLTNPINKAFEEQLKGIHRYCIDRSTNTLKDEEFIAMANAFKALVLQEHADREGDLSQILEKFQEKHDIQVVKLKPLAKVLMLELGEKITD
jgi:hypothetical protein